MKSLLRAAAFWCLFSSHLAFRAEAGISFVQLTDPHLFDKDAKNDRALRDCVEEINRRKKEGADFRFVVVTGDIGIEQLVSEKPPGAAERQALPPAEIEKKQGPQKFAALIEPCSVKKWLFLPGNNDLIEERPETLDYYTNFISRLHEQLKPLGFEIIDLTPREDTNSGIYRDGDYTLLGFNDASFKSNNKAQNMKQWKASDSDAIEKVRQRLHAGKNVYIFYHIPEVDDPYFVSGMNPAELKALFDERGVTDSPYEYSAWTVTPGVRDAWNAVASQEQVKGLFAGHFHDSRRESYTDLRWLKTPSYSLATLSKLHVCPPLAEKKQEKKIEQARGFQIVDLDDTGRPSVQIVWYNKSLFSNDESPRENGPLLEKTIALSVDPTAHTASATLRLFNGTRVEMKVALSATDFVSTTTKRSIGGRVTLAGPGQTAGQEFYEASVPAGAIIPVRIEASGLWEAGELIGKVLDHGNTIGTLCALNSRPTFSVKLTGEKPEIHFVDGERQRIALHNDDAMTYRATAQIAFGSLLSDPVPVDLAPGGDSFFEIQLPENWFQWSSALKRQIVDGEIILALDAPAATSAPDLPRRRIPFKGSLNWIKPFGQAVWSYAFILVFLVLGGVVSLLMGNYFPNQARRSRLADEHDEVRSDVDALPTAVDSEFRAQLRVGCHRLRARLIGDKMVSAEAPARLDATAVQIGLLRKKTELVTKLCKLTQKLDPFDNNTEKNQTDVKALFDTVEQTKELLRARHTTDADLASAIQNVQNAIERVLTRTPAAGTVPEPTEQQIFDIFKSQPLSIVMDPTSPDAYQVVTLTVKFADGTSPFEKVKCNWECGDGLRESGWKIFHYYAWDRLRPLSSEPRDKRARQRQGELKAKFELHGRPIPLSTGNELIHPFKVGPERAAESAGRNRAEIARLGLALAIALVGLLATAQGELAKSDFFAAAIAVFLLGFTANAVKDILAPKTART